MGYASRLNPRSLDGKVSERPVLNARLTRFAEFFANRAEYEDYLTKAKVTPAECAYLETLLPARLTVGGNV